MNVISRIKRNRMRFFLALTFTFITLFSNAQPKAVVDKAVVKLDKVKEGTTVHHVYKIKNEGNSPLILHDYNVGCPCTKILLPKTPILPGETVEVPMEFDSKGKFYLQDRVIVVNTNAPKKELLLRFKIYVQ